MITYQTEDIAMPSIKKRETTEWVKQVAATYGKKVGEVAYIFCSDEKILEVNRQYLEHDYYTDIITFDYTEGNRISGDLFISLDTVRTNAEQFEQPYPRHPTPMRQQRQGSGRTRNHGSRRKQSIGFDWAINTPLPMLFVLGTDYTDSHGFFQ